MELTGDHLQYVDSYGLSDEEIETRLSENDVGVLALADGGRPYAIPVHYRYDPDGDALYLRLTDDGDSRKFEYLAATHDPEFLVYGHGGRWESWSVVLTGALEELADPESEGIDPATVNDWFGPARVFDEAVEAVTVRLYRFDVGSATGRQTLG